MRLKRNITTDGICKYSLIENEKVFKIETGLPGSENEFFVIKLKDVNSTVALEAYAKAVEDCDPEFAADIRELAGRSGLNHAHCHHPD